MHRGSIPRAESPAGAASRRLAAVPTSLSRVAARRYATTGTSTRVTQRLMARRTEAMARPHARPEARAANLLAQGLPPIRRQHDLLFWYQGAAGTKLGRGGADHVRAV